jgi:hypothetical protein
MRSQSLTHAQLYAAHAHFKKAVLSVVGQRKVNGIMNIINEVVQSPAWNKNAASSSLHIKCRNAIHALLHDGPALSPAISCAKCADGGIVIRCSGFGTDCKQHFHINCASSYVEQTKKQSKSYYCEDCTLLISKKGFKQKSKQAKPLPKIEKKRLVFRVRGLGFRV